MPQFRLRPPVAILVGTLFTSIASGASGEIRIEVLDRDGSPVPEVAVYLQPAGSGPVDSQTASVTALSAARHSSHSETAAINQHELSFNPHVSIIETGTAVAFPNDDEVRHHVYSFSPAKRLNMTINSHSVHPEKPVFDQPGVVTLGCNIHDNMLAYILVVDTPLFGKTNGDGAATLTMPADGQFELNIWTPRLAANDLPAPQVIKRENGESLTVTYQFDKKLFPPHAHSETNLQWDDY